MSFSFVVLTAYSTFLLILAGIGMGEQIKRL